MKYEKKPISDILRSTKTVFTFKDISLIWGDSDQKATIDGVNYYVKTGELYRIRRGIYAKDKNYDKLELATRIFTPSYVSFETVLTQTGINFQFYKKITVASYQTREIEVDGQVYSYKKIKDFVLTNPAGVEHKNETSVAGPERAFLDTIYIHKDYHFDNLGSLNWDKVFEMLPIYKNKRMAKKVNEFFKKYKGGELIKQRISDKIKEDMFAHKLMAMHERVGKTSRDIYDVWFFLEHRWPINKVIVEKRAGMTFPELMQKCIEQLEKMNNRNILDGLGDLLTEPQKDWARTKLRTEAIFLLKARLESEK